MRVVPNTCPRVLVAWLSLSDIGRFSRGRIVTRMSYREWITRPMTAPLRELRTFTRKLTLNVRKAPFLPVAPATDLVSLTRCGRLSLVSDMIILLVYFKLRNSCSLMILRRLAKPPLIDITDWNVSALITGLKDKEFMKAFPLRLIPMTPSVLSPCMVLCMEEWEVLTALYSRALAGTMLLDRRRLCRTQDPTVLTALL